MADHIQIGDITPRKRYVADGVQTLFTYPFPIFKAVDLEVYLDGALQETGYEVSGAGHDLGGEVTFGTAPTMGVAVTLRRRLTIARQSDFQESGAFRARVINDELDFLTAALQQVADDTRRALQLSPTDPDAVLTLPDRAARGGTFLAFDAEGKPVPGAGSIGGLPTTTFITTLLDDTDAPAAPRSGSPARGAAGRRRRGGGARRQRFRVTPLRPDPHPWRPSDGAQLRPLRRPRHGHDT